MILIFVRVTEQHYVSIRYSSLVYGLCANLCFSSTRVAWGLINKKCHFSAVFALFFAYRLALYLYTCAVENPEISGFCVSKSRGLRAGHKRVKKIET